MKVDYESLELQIEEEYNRTQRLTSSISLAPVQTGKKQDDIWVDVFDNIEEVVSIFKKEQEKCINKLKQVNKAIRQLRMPVERTIIRLRYVEGITYEEIADRLEYSERMVRYYHIDALEKLKIPKEPEETEDED